MASVSVSDSFDVEQGLLFQNDRTSSVGHLVSITIAGTVLASDIQTVNPTDGARAMVVGVLESVAWAGGPSDPIELVAHISEANHQRLSSLLLAPHMANTPVALNFAGYGYDHPVKKYYESFGSQQPPLNGTIKMDGDSPAVEVAAGPTGNPATWRLSLSIVPSPGSQALLVASSSQTRRIQSWGLAPAKAVG